MDDFPAGLGGNLNPFRSSVNDPIASINGVLVDCCMMWMCLIQQALVVITGTSLLTPVPLYLIGAVSGPSSTPPPTLRLATYRPSLSPILELASVHIQRQQLCHCHSRVRRPTCSSYTNSRNAYASTTTDSLTVRLASPTSHEVESNCLS